jgi:hypothetical protein
MSAQLFAQRTMLTATLLISALTGLCGSSVAEPSINNAGPIGKVETVAGSATIEHTGDVVVQASLSTGETSAKPGDPVYRGDVVRTGAAAKLALVFNDGTSFNIDANARMELNEYVYDPKGKSNSTLFNLQKGSFTFLAGTIAKTGNMKVETPVGTMGIRGTAPHVEILEDGTVKFTTLVEEKKKNEQTKVRLTPQRKVENTPARSRVDEALTKQMTICRGC